jgi:hypothetical protein
LKPNPVRAGLPRLAVALLLAASRLVTTDSVHAQNGPAETSPQVWLNAGTYSHHFNRDKNFRENNTGFGAEVWLSDDHALMAGPFMNSDDERSRYVAYQWRPFHWQPAGIRIGAGISLGAFDGYPRYRNGGWFPSALPALSIEYKMVGINLFLVPTIPDRIDGAISLQLKLRVW